MAKFKDFSEAEQVTFLKEEFIRIVEELLINPAEVQKLLGEDKYKIVMEFVPSVKVKDCGCGTCIDINKLDARIPEELECLIDVARKRCEELTY